MDEYIQNALNKLHKEIKSQERLQVEAEQYKRWLSVAKQNDTGLLIREANDIVKEFEEVLRQTYGDVVEDLSSRADLSFSEMKFDSKNDAGELFTVESKVTKDQLNFCYSMFINDEEGGESTLTITCEQSPFEIIHYSSFGEPTTEGFNVEITYANGSVVYNDEQGLFLPLQEDGIPEVDIDNCKEKLVDFISSEIVSLKEYVDSVRDEAVNNGKYLFVAKGLFCKQCYEEYICIDEELAEIGTCLNCGEQNDIAQCEGCGQYVIDNEEIKLCDSCKNNTDDNEDA